MNKKLFYAALALPMMFAACSQEDLFEGVQSGNDAQQGTLKATFTVDNGSTTRAIWNDGTQVGVEHGLAFDGTDKFSLYWLGKGAYNPQIVDDKEVDGNAVTTATDLVGYTNAVFAQKSNDGSFTSQSLVFEGKNIAVFPADLAHISQKDIEIEIDEVQTAATVKEVPYISNVLDLKAWNDVQSSNKAGYEVDVNMPIKQAANVFDMTLNLANHTGLVGAEKFNLTIEKVELIASNNIFTNSATVQSTGVKPVNPGKISCGTGNSKYEKESILAQAEVATTADQTTLVSTAITPKDETGDSYLVRFVVLPTDAVVLTGVPNLTAAGTKVKVYTNCGVVTLNSKNLEYQTLGEGEKDETVNGDFFVNKAGDQKLSIAQMFKSITEYATQASEGSFKGEKVGKYIKRSIVVDMKKADFSSITVESDTKIKHYVSLYTSIEKTGNMSLNLKPNANGEFSISADAVKAVDDLHASLNVQGKASQGIITLNGDAVLGETSATAKIILTTPGAVYNIARLNATSDVVYSLAPGNWTMNDNIALNTCASIENNGTLTIKSTATEGVQNSLTTTLTNNGTLKIDANSVNNTLKVASVLASTSKGTIEIASKQILNFVSGSANSSLDGTVNVNGRLTTDITNVTLDGTVNNYHIIGASEDGGFTNNGVINVLTGNIATYIHDNTGSRVIDDKTVPARINLLTRTDEVVTIAGNEGQIVYNWTAKDGATLNKEVGDKFTYVVINTGVLTDGALTIGAGTTKVDVEFNDSGVNGVKVIADDEVYVRDVVVNKDCSLHVLSGNVFQVRSFKNYGDLTLGGTLNTMVDASNELGDILTVGSGKVTDTLLGTTWN